MRKNNQLNLIDLLFVCIVLFGIPIATSIANFLALPQSDLDTAANFTFTESDNYGSIYMEIINLVIAAAYLYWRKFNFRQLNISFDRYTLPLTVALILIAGSITHIFYTITIVQPTISENEAEQLVELSSYFSLSLILFSLLNGFYEEVFFLGLAFAVPKSRLPYVLIISLIVRFLFHTYQGITSAIGITLFGLIFLALRFRLSNLVPFMLAHSFFDIFGLGLPLWLIP